MSSACEESVPCIVLNEAEWDVLGESLWTESAVAQGLISLRAGDTDGEVIIALPSQNLLVLEQMLQALHAQRGLSACEATLLTLLHETRILHVQKP